MKNPMFNLDQAIHEWRRQMATDGVKSSATLDELENHLREDVAQRVQSGSNAEEAFKIGVERIGTGVRLKTEFKNAGTSLETRLANLIGIACASVAFLFSAWILFATFFVKIDFVSKLLGLSAIVTAVLSWRYNYKYLPRLSAPLVRTIVGFMCCVVGVIWMLVFVEKIIPGVMKYPPGKDLQVGRLFVVFLWGWTVMAVLSGVGPGLEKAVAKRNATPSA
jgi:hypothetical protein